jgi:hypothetical protein
METIQDPNIWQTFLLLLQTLLRLIEQLAVLGFQYALWLLFAAICLWAINWKKTRHVLAIGGWVPALLLILLIAIVWSRIDPRPCAVCGLPNFWWQLGYTSMLAAIAMVLGWVQSVMHWTPHEFNLDPPAHAHGHGGHGHDHGHH